MRADLARVGVIGAYEPFAVPAGGLDRLGDLSDFRADVGRLLGHVCVIHAGELAVVLDDVGVLAAIEYEHAADEHGFRHAGVVVLHGLEALARGLNHIFLCRVIEMAAAHGCPFVGEMI